MGLGGDDLALHGNHVGDEIRRGSGGENYRAAADLTVVDHQGFHRLAALADGSGDDIAVHRERHQPIAGEVQGEDVGGAQRHRTELGRDQAGVGHRRSDQADQAAGGSGDASLIDDLRVGVARLVEGRLARRDVRIRRVTGGGDQRTDIHRRAFAKQDAVAVDQHYLAVGQQAAENLRRIVAADAVHRDRGGSRLDELGRLPRSDVEALPIDDDDLGRLIDLQRIGGRR